MIRCFHYCHRLALVFCLVLVRGTIWWFSSMAVNAAAASETVLSSARDQLTQHIPVLCYHRFGNYSANDAYSVSVTEFKRQLEIIQEEGYTPISVSQLATGWTRRDVLPKKVILITVDDGYKDFRRHAEPLLKKFGYPATLFIYTEFVGSRLGLSRSALYELQQAGIEIGSHSATHPKLNQRLEGETPEARKKRLEQELAGSRKRLQAWSGGEVIALAYPYGLWDQEVAAIAKEAGYQLMFTVNPGTNTQDTPRYCLKRNMILRGMRETTFRRLLQEKELPIQKWHPDLGTWVQGPVTEAYVVLAPEFREVFHPRSIRAQRGQTRLPLNYNPQTGRLVMTFPQAWQRGTDLIVITARHEKDNTIYKQSWLLMVESAQSQKGR